MTKKNITGTKHFQNAAGESIPSASNDNTFVKYHLAITANDFLESQSEDDTPGNYNSNTDTRLVLSKIENPTARDFLAYLQKVGSKYGWDKRTKYQLDNLETIQEMMEKRQCELFLFHVNSEEVGFCMTAGIDRDRAPDLKRPYEKGIEKGKAVNMFMRQKNLSSDHYEPIEIYKIGLYDDYTGKGYGNFFLNRVMDVLFSKRKYDVIYLDTRSTNHDGVLSFYEKNGVNVFFKEELPSDLVHEPTNWQNHNQKHSTQILIDSDSGASYCPLLTIS